MSEHARYLELAATAIDFDLSPTEQADLTAHLAGCDDCRRAASALLADARMLRRLSDGAPAERVRYRVLSAGPRRRTSPLVAIAAAAAIVVAALGGLMAGAVVRTAHQDGTTTEPVWTRLSAPDGFPAGEGTSEVSGVAAVPGVGSVDLVAVGTGSGDGRVWLWAAGHEWSRVADVTGLDRARPVAVASIGSRLIAVGQRTSQGGEATAAAWVSNDARAWTRSDLAGSTGLFAVAASPARIVVGGAGRADAGLPIWSSADGQAWLPAMQTTKYTTASVTGIAVGGPGFVAVGYDDRGAVVWTSPDAATWTRVDHPTFVLSRMTAVAATPAGLVAVGYDVHGPAAWTSLDGVAWARSEPFGAVGARATGVVASPFGIIAVGNAPGGARAWISPDGGRWLPLSEPTWAGSCEITSIVAHGTQVFAGGSIADKAGVWLGRLPVPTP